MRNWPRSSTTSKATERTDRSPFRHSTIHAETLAPIAGSPRSSSTRPAITDASGSAIVAPVICAPADTSIDTPCRPLPGRCPWVSVRYRGFEAVM